MNFYHFTGIEYLDGIASEGLCRGKLAHLPKKVKTAVWLAPIANVAMAFR